MGMGTLEPVRTSLGEPLIKFSEISPAGWFHWSLQMAVVGLFTPWKWINDNSVLYFSPQEQVYQHTMEITQPRRKHRNPNRNPC